MSKPDTPEGHSDPESNQSFGGMLAEFERSHSRKSDDGGNQIQGAVITVSADSVFVDIGFKSEGILPLAEFQRTGETVKAGDKITVSVKGRDPEGYYQL
jgi:small subunit ribosomal protein S1